MLPAYSAVVFVLMLPVRAMGLRAHPMPPGETKYEQTGCRNNVLRNARS
jgi:hypothetical protein